MCERCWTGDPERDAQISADIERDHIAHQIKLATAPLMPTWNPTPKEYKEVMEQLKKLLIGLSETYEMDKTRKEKDYRGRHTY